MNEVPHMCERVLDSLCARTVAKDSTQSRLAAGTEWVMRHSSQSSCHTASSPLITVHLLQGNAAHESFSRAFFDSAGRFAGSKCLLGLQGACGHSPHASRWPRCGARHLCTFGHFWQDQPVRARARGCCIETPGWALSVVSEAIKGVCMAGHRGLV